MLSAHTWKFWEPAPCVRKNGMDTRANTKWSLFWARVCTPQLFGGIGLAGFVVYCLRGLPVLETPLGLIYLIIVMFQAVVPFLLCMSQLIAQARVQQGILTAAGLMLVPAYQMMLWALFASAVQLLVIFTYDHPNEPEFASQAFAGNVMTANQFTLCTLFIAVHFFNLSFGPQFLFLENSLSRSCINRAIFRGTVASLVSGILISLGLQLRAVTSSDVPIGFINSATILVSTYMNLGLYLKSRKSSRKSYAEFTLFMTVVGTFGPFICLAFLLTNAEASLDSNFSLALGICYATVSNGCLFVALYRDTKYWRGETRKPIWCANAEFSPYDSLSDSLIQNEIPALIERSSIKFIDFAFLKYDNMIGAGATARVYKGKVCVGGNKKKPVAIKVFTPIEISAETLTEFANEIAKYEKLQHPRVMRLYGVSICPPDVSLVCEFCEKGALHDVLHSQQFSIRDKMRISAQVAESVCFIHELNPPVIHRDLKSQNFLVDANGDVKLSDFGTSVEMTPTPQGRPRAMTKMVGSMPWMSPEVLSGSQEYGLEADIFSLGIVLWEVWSQRDPYDGVHSKSLADHVMSGNRPPIPEFCPREIAELMESMWHPNVANRPSARDVFDVLNALQDTMWDENDNLYTPTSL